VSERKRRFDGENKPIEVELSNEPRKEFRMENEIKRIVFEITETKTITSRRFGF
jgi:hypothetical protein